MRPELVQLLRLAGPVIVARLGIMTMGLVDTVVVGRHSAAELGFMALGLAPAAVMLTTGVGLLAGVQVMTARAIGAGRPEAAGPVLRRGLAYAFWLGAGAATALVAFGPAFLAVAGIEPALAAGAAPVLRVFALSLPAAFAAAAISGSLEALGRPGAAVWAMWVANALNLALDLVLVGGGFGVPALGAIGAAWATFAARGALFAALLLYVANMKDARALGVFARPRPDRAAAAGQRRIGYAAGAALFVETAAFAGMNIIAGWVGGLTVAGWAVVLNVSSVVFMVPLGLAAAASVLVARAHGAGDPARVRRAGGLGLAATVALCALVSLVVWPGAELIAAAYVREPALAALVAMGLRLACLFFIADGLQVVTAHMLRAVGDVWLSTAVQIASYAAVMLPLGWALALPAGLGLAGIVWAVVAASFMSAGLLLARFAWRTRGPRPGAAEVTAPRRPGAASRRA